MQFRKSNNNFDDDILFGPPHIVLPIKYSTTKNNYGVNGDISDWSIFIGDDSGTTIIGDLKLLILYQYLRPDLVIYL